MTHIICKFIFYFNIIFDFRSKFNPSERGDIVPNADGTRTDWTIRTINENENSFNPFNKCGIQKETFDITTPGSLNRSKQGLIKSYDSNNYDLISQPYNYANRSINDNSKVSQNKSTRYLDEDSIVQNLHPNQIHPLQNTVVGNSIHK